MKKQNLNKILIVTGTITLILLVLGIVFQQSEYERLNGFTSKYAVSTKNDLAYVDYHKGESHIYLYGDREPVAIIDEKKEINDLIFSANNQSLIYAVTDREIDNEKLKSTVYELSLETQTEIELFQDDKIITEISLDPKDSDMIYYLAATSFENYSPIASSAPHNFDIYRYSTETGEIDRITKLDKYAITSLQISSRDHIAYIKMDDDLEAETADEIFESTQKVFTVPIDKPDELSVFEFTDKAGDIYDILYIEEENMLVYQAVSGENDRGIFQYDLYIVDMESNIEKQLTDLKHYTAKPIYSPADSKIYFVIDKQFAGKEADYELYRINLDRTGVEQVELN